MTTEQMYEFVVLAEERNYLVAADILYLTQATLSRHIMAMEEELGFPLFNRSTKKIEMTPEGNRFLMYARNAVRIRDAYTTAIANVKNRQDGILRVGYSPLVTFYMLTDQLTRFMIDNPDVEIKISEGSSEELTASVRNGSLDVALMQENPFEKPKNVDYVRYFTDILVAILPKGHALSYKKTIELPELSEEKFVFAPLNSEPAMVELEACRRSGLTPNIVRDGLVGHVLYDWVAKGGYVALDWKEPARHHSNNKIALVDVAPPLYSNSLIIFNRKELTESGKKLVCYFEKHSSAKEMIDL